MVFIQFRSKGFLICSRIKFLLRSGTVGRAGLGLTPSACSGVRHPRRPNGPTQGGSRGGGGVDTPLPQGFDPKGLPLYYFEISIFGDGP